jgi:ABC-2 type transport system permease protein
MVALLGILSLIRQDRVEEWAMFSTSATAIWAFFMLPMTVTALTVLVAQLEHGSRSWNHLLALPLPRWRLYAAKLAVVLLLAAGMTLGLWLALPLAGGLAEAVKSGTQLSGAYDWSSSAQLLGRMFASAVLLIVIQLWAALHFRSFVPPLVLGIGGTFVGVAATGSEHGIWFPWLIPTNALASDPARADIALALGAGGGAAVAALMLVHLSRREFA